MTLQFPTIAEQVEREFRESPKTVSIATLAKRRGATVERNWTGWTYTFDDDTTLRVTGVGRNHKVETFLP